MIKIDLERAIVTVEDAAGSRSYALATPEAFSIISQAWLRCGWDNKHVYSFTWLGRPVIQLPEDLIRIQEVVYRIKPDVIIETGIAHGGSLVFFASLCHAMGRGRVIGVDVEIRPHNRTAIETHELFPYITLIEGSSIEKSVVSQVKALVKPGEKTLVVLDSNHTKSHVLDELRAYADLVSRDSYIIATDGIMADLAGAPRSNADWGWNNPKAAAAEFVRENPDFRLEEPTFLFNEGTIQQWVTYWPGAFLRRVV